TTRPFKGERACRGKFANEGIENLKSQVDTLIVIPNDRLLQMADKRATLQQAFSLADDVLRQGIQGISELITVPALINLDFADVRTIMSEGGAALMAVGRADGDDRARSAAEMAINSTLLDVTIDGARGILFNITGGTDLTLFEINEAAAIIKESAHPDVNLIFGAQIDDSMGDECRITVIATGFEQGRAERRINAERQQSVPVQRERPRQQAPRQQAPRQPQQQPVERQEPPQFQQRQAPPPQQQQPRPQQDEPRIYDESNTDIPAFLRRRNNR
ncbi:MAG: cell division protein FtsZ, partial [Chloroflexota bacterium]